MLPAKAFTEIVYIYQQVVEKMAKENYADSYFSYKYMEFRMKRNGQ